MSGEMGQDSFISKVSSHNCTSDCCISDSIPQNTAGGKKVTFLKMYKSYILLGVRDSCHLHHGFQLCQLPFFSEWKISRVVAERWFFGTLYRYLAYHLCLIKKNAIKIHHGNVSILDATCRGYGSGHCDTRLTTPAAWPAAVMAASSTLQAASELRTHQLQGSFSRHHLREKKAFLLWGLRMTMTTSSSNDHNTKEFLGLELAFSTLFGTH